ncbi:hypothetical protein [Agrobacterium larrymoorei]|uniref:Phage tail tape measure protein n=1 Tax=Agrobacterium larrymoorei TaxID=160699 RepID=A0ABU0UID5_9HYPH|nr:hypothetical protein [Agrobacterium larrymoorei]MDQ1184702.1 hypothetical protein [Agrobacterium larrymoorei]
MELEKLSSTDLAAIIAKAGAILARRAGDQRPAQMPLLPDLDPIDPATVDLDERLADGSRRWLAPKEAAAIVGKDADTIIRKIKNDGIGIQIGGRYFADHTKIKGVVFRAVAAAGGRVLWTLTKLSLVGLAVGAAATWIYNNWNNLLNFFSGFADGFSKTFEGFGPALTPIVTGFGDLYKWVSGLLGPINDTNGAFKSWGETVGGVVAGAVNSVVAAIERLIGGIRSAVEWAGSLKDKLGGLMTWGSGGGGAEMPSYDAMGNPTGHRATGGPVWPGGSFVVGDGGEPEIFTPKTAGTITPMSKAGGSVSIGPFTFHGISGDAAELEARVRRAVSDGVDQLLRGAHADAGAYS